MRHIFDRHLAIYRENKNIYIYLNEHLINENANLLKFIDCERKRDWDWHLSAVRAL